MLRRIYIIAGEKSGEHYGAQLVDALKKLDPQIDCYGFGGDEMEASGVCLSRRLEHLEIIGFTEVLQKIGSVRENFAVAKREIRNLKPDAVILIDYPGFNLRIAKWAKSQDFKVFYFIAPQTWAWKRKRNRILADFVDQVYSILPFETKILSEDKVNHIYVGHPMVDDIMQFQNLNLSGDKKNQSGRKKVAVLPGSRRSEILRLKNILCTVFDARPDLHFILAAMSDLPKSIYKEFEQRSNVELKYDEVLHILEEADYGIIKSGTSTLQAALLNLPQLVIYRVSTVSGWIMKFFAKIAFVSLPNLILGTEIVKEFLQEDCTAENIMAELNRLAEPEVKNDLIKSYKIIQNLLSKSENTVDLVAKSIYENLEDNKL